VALALRARLRLQRSGGERWVEARDFFRGLFTTALEPEEMLTEIALPSLPPRTGWSFLEIARRHGDYGQAGVAALVTLDEAGRCREARLVYLNVGDGPVEASRAAALLAGEALTPERIAAAAELAAREEMNPGGDIHASAAFKRHLARVLTIRALGAAVARAQGEGTR
jgi:carbon-monoxide dehydrogenase medium subunit